MSKKKKTEVWDTDPGSWILLQHKPYVLPDVNVTHGDEASPEYLEHGEHQPVTDENGNIKYTIWHRKADIYRNAWEVYQDDWRGAVEGYEADPGDFYAAHAYLDSHPIFWYFEQYQYEKRDPYEGYPANAFSRLVHERGISRGVSIDVVKVNPENEKIEGFWRDEEHLQVLNTATRVWYELGKFDLYDGKHHWHDWRLDSGGKTYEEAIIKAARAVWETYGNDRVIADEPDESEIPGAKVTPDALANVVESLYGSGRDQSDS